jgi:hypothetical protein
MDTGGSFGNAAAGGTMLHVSTDVHVSSQAPTDEQLASRLAALEKQLHRLDVDGAELVRELLDRVDRIERYLGLTRIERVRRVLPVPPR